MMAENPDKPKKFSQWNPLQSFQTQDEALKAAKSGVWVCAFLGASYILQIIFVFYNGKNTFGDAGDSTLVASNYVGVALAAFLAWRIWAKQGFWATTFLALWFILEIVGKVSAIASGQQRTNVGWIVMFAALTVMTILAVRGSWKLRQERKSHASQL